MGTSCLNLIEIWQSKLDHNAPDNWFECNRDRICNSGRFGFWYSTPISLIYSPLPVSEFYLQGRKACSALCRFLSHRFRGWKIIREQMQDCRQRSLFLDGAMLQTKLDSTGAPVLSTHYFDYVYWESWRSGAELLPCYRFKRHALREALQAPAPEFLDELRLPLKSWLPPVAHVQLNKCLLSTPHAWVTAPVCSEQFLKAAREMKNFWYGELNRVKPQSRVKSWNLPKPQLTIDGELLPTIVLDSALECARLVHVEPESKVIRHSGQLVPAKNAIKNWVFPPEGVFEGSRQHLSQFSNWKSADWQLRRSLVGPNSVGT